MSVKDRARQAAAGAVLKAAEKAEDTTGGNLADEKETTARKGIRGLAADDRAQAHGAGRAVNLVVALVVGGLMAAFLLPIAIDEIVAVDTTNWTNGAAALWDILPVMIVLAIFLFFVGVALKKSGKM